MTCDVSPVAMFFMSVFWLRTSELLAIRVARVFSKAPNLSARLPRASSDILFFAEESSFEFFLLLMGDVERLRLGVKRSLEESPVIAVPLFICWVVCTD